MTATTHFTIGTDPWEKVALGSGIGVPVAIGGELTPETLLGAYRRGIFCQPRDDHASIADNERTYAPDVVAGDIPLLPGPGNPYATLWWSPATRYVIPVGEIHLGRTLHKTLRAAPWTTTVNTAFPDVITACGTARQPRWLTGRLTEALHTLNAAGWVKSIEVWHDDELVGGLFGCCMDGAFTMDSTFHTRTGASKTAIADLANRTSGGTISLLDAQVRTEYTTRMGARPLPRDAYRRHLEAGTGTPGRLLTDSLPAARLITWDRERTRTTTPATAPRDIS